MLQKKILKSAYTLEDGTVHETGRLALGVPGQFYDASPRRVHTEVLDADAEPGQFVEGKGVLVNVRELALSGTEDGTLEPSLKVSNGDAASFCTFGHVVVKKSELEAIMGGMKATVIAGDPESDIGETVVVELEGLSSAHAEYQGLCLTSLEDGSTVKLLGEEDSGVKGDYKISYDGSTWENYAKGRKISLDEGEKVYFSARATNAEIGWYDEGSDTGNSKGFEMSGRIEASGNIQFLTDATGRSVETSPRCYSSLFIGCSSLVTAPELPAEVMSEKCYAYMFEDCTSLTETPALPANTLSKECYSFMFAGCTSLTSAPALPATTLDEYCYNGMFSGCSSLVKAPDLIANMFANGSYQNMFLGCSSLNYIKVAFDSWHQDLLLTSSWVAGVGQSGEFHCPSALMGTGIKTGMDFCPTGWSAIAED